MATLTVEDVADLVATTLADLDKGKWTDLTGDIQEYHAMPNLLKEGKVKYKSGDSISVNIMTGTNGQARWTGLLEEDNYAINDVMSSGTAPWRHGTWNYSFDRREKEINGGDAEQIVDLIKTRRAASFIDGAKLLEDMLWSKPATSADVTTPYGLRTYIVSNASEGFNGGNPSGFTSGVIFNSSTQSRWKNWTAQYTNITPSDLVRKLRKAARNTMFKSPIEMKEIRNGSLKRALYTNQDVIEGLEEIVTAQNDNLGSDIAKYDGQTIFRKNPVHWVPQLDSDTQDPILGVDWETLVPVFLK
ncbi:MAG TPA: hypothetical protein VEJ63_19770, partial [Planctomycetota bacterium]|nr:hypothetical protein [Planctomycetota bacterium]